MQLRMNTTILIILLLFCSSALPQENIPVPKKESITRTKLDPSVRPDDKEELSEIFKDVVVVQRKAKQKAKKILLSTYTSFDFSDGPITMYAFNINPGYALNDFWEIYLNYVPVFVTNERSIVKKVEDLTLINGRKASITYVKPKSQIGIEVLWAPAYGKDSWGPYSIVRSDTYFKLGVSQIRYETDSGLKTSLLLGKTYFVGNNFNLRISAGLAQVQQIIDNEKTATTMAILETGVVFYW